MSALLFPTKIADALKTTQQLIIVPTLDIGTIPFALLKPFGTEELLIDRMSICIAPSLYDLELWPEPWPTPAQWQEDIHANLRPLVLGNPVFTSDGKFYFPPLPGAEAEAKAVAALLNVAPLCGTQATKSTVVQAAKMTSLLYFATHGVSDSDQNFPTCRIFRDHAGSGCRILSSAVFSRASARLPCLVQLMPLPF